MGYLLSFAWGLIVGGLFVYAYCKNAYEYDTALAEERELRANRANGKLANKIFKQRLVIKTLKANQPPKVKQPIIQQTISH